MASSMAQVRRTEMDIGHQQRLGTTLDLSAGSDWREGPLVKAAFGKFAMFVAPHRASNVLALQGGSFVLSDGSYPQERFVAA
jgi:hypothetical protein